MRIKTLAYIFLVCTIFVQTIFTATAPKFAYATEQDEPVETITELPEYPGLIISAVQITGGTGKTQEDFIELFNPTDQPFDLNGHRLVKRTASGALDSVIKAWDSETIIQARHFYLWANSGYGSISGTADTTSSATLADNNGVALRFGDNDAGEIIDSVAWGSTANGFENKSSQNPGANESLVRTDLLNEESDYEIVPSSPRNSTIVFDPEETSEPPVEDEPEEVDEETEEEKTQEESEPVVLLITEILPNPSGSDSGFEQVEIYNAGAITVSLTGYRLDDIASNQPLSSNAYTLPQLEIAPDSYLAVTFPAGSMSLNNTGGDVLSLFNTAGELVVSAYYEGISPEAKSYSLFSSGWQWADPTFGESNGQPPHPTEDDDDNEVEEENTETVEDYDNSRLEITEIFPQPDSAGAEFIEIYNAGTENAQLSYVSMYVGERKKLLPKYDLAPGKHFVIEQSALPVQLRNSGQIIKLQEDSKVLSTVTYPVAVENASFAKFEDGFLWTTKITKSAENILEIPEQIKKAAEEAAAKTATTKKVSVKKPAASSLAATSKAVTTKTTSNPTNAKLAESKISESSSESQPAESASEEAQKKQKESLSKIIAMGAAAVTAGVAALYKLVFTVGAE